MKTLIARIGLRILGLVTFAFGNRAQWARQLRRRLSLAVLYDEDVFAWRIEMARDYGVKIGENCKLFTLDFSSEPYLIEIGDHVVIGAGTKLITHDGATWVFADVNNLEDATNVYGRIKIGSNVFIGVDCIIVCNVEIGDNCVIGAGSVVRSDIPQNSVAFGNPAKVVMPVSVYRMMVESSDRMMRHHPWSAEKHKDIMKKFGVTG